MPFVQSRFANMTLDSDRRELLRDDVAIALNPKAFELLSILVDSWPSAVSKEALYEKLWPGVFVEMGNLHNLVSDIRVAIDDDDHSIIRTIHRFGYAMATNVEREGVLRAHLVIGTRELPLHEGEQIVGRDVVGSPDVSRRHVRITLSGSTATLEDLGSKNGTWSDGHRIKGPLVVNADQEIVLGRTRAFLRFATPDGATVTAPPLSESRE